MTKIDPGWMLRPVYAPAIWTRPDIRPDLADIPPDLFWREPQLCHTYDRGRWSHWPCVAEPKADGFRVAVYVDAKAGTVEITSRNDCQITALQWMAPLFLSMCRHEAGPVILDGEAVCGTIGETASALRNRTLSARRAMIYLFDATPAIHRDFTKWTDRRKRVERLCANMPPDCPIKAIPVFWCDGPDSVGWLLMRAVASGWEGLVLKDPDAPYISKSRAHWCRLKPVTTIDGVVVDVIASKGAHHDRAGALVVLADGKDMRVSAGLSDADRVNCWAGYVGQSPDLNPVGRFVEIAGMGRTPTGLLREPRFVRWRDDLGGTIRRAEK